MKNLVLGILVRELRKQKNLSQELLAELAEINVRTIQRLEKTGAYSADTLNAVADAFDLDSKELIAKAAELTAQVTAETQKKQEELYFFVTLHRVRNGKHLTDMISGVHMLQPDYPSELTAAQQATVGDFFDYLSDYIDIDSELTHSQRLQEQETLRTQINMIEQSGLSIFAGRHRRICRHEQGDPFTMECTVVSAVLAEDSKIQRSLDGQETLRAALERKRRLSF